MTGQAVVVVVVFLAGWLFVGALVGFVIGRSITIANRQAAQDATTEPLPTVDHGGGAR